MSLRVGEIDLPGVQTISTEEARTLVEQRSPEQQGSVFQDLGREPVTVLVNGFLFGPDTGTALEKLRTAQAKAEPQAFAADIAIGTELTDVVVEAFRVQQIAGYASRFRFFMRLREYVEPPQPAAAGLAAVDAEVAAQASALQADNLAVAAVLVDPASFTGALGADPALLDRLDMADLGDAVTRNMATLDATGLDDMVGAVAAADPAKAAGLLERLKSNGGLGAMLAKYAQSGLDFLSKVDLGKLKGAVGALITAAKGGLDFLRMLKATVGSVGDLIGAFTALRLPPGLGGTDAGDGAAKVSDRTPDGWAGSLSDVLGRTRTVLDDVTALLGTDTVKALADVAAQAGVGKALADGLAQLGAGVRQAAARLAPVLEALILADAAVVVLQLAPALLAAAAQAVRDAGTLAGELLPGLDTVQPGASVAAALQKGQDALAAVGDAAEAIMAFVGPAAFRDVLEAADGVGQRIVKLGAELAATPAANPA